MNTLEQLEAKMTEELNTYRAWLLTQPPEEILNHAYEYSTKQDIILNVADAGLSPAQIETMLRSPCPLEDVFKEASYSDMSDYNSFLSFCIAAARRRRDSNSSAPHPSTTARRGRRKSEVNWTSSRLRLRPTRIVKLPLRTPSPAITTAHGLTQRPRSPRCASSSVRSAWCASRPRS